MNKIILLIKVMLKSGFRSTKSSKKKKIGYGALIVFMIFSFIPLIALYIDFLKKSMEALMTINQEGIILSLGFLLNCTIIFFFGIFYIMSTFYFSKDTNSLIPLPLKANDILLSKLSVVLIYEYLTELVVLTPIVIVYGMESEAGVLFYLYALIVFLLLPLIPLVLVSLIVMIVMRFTSIAKDKDKYAIFAGLIAMAAALSFNYFFQRATNQDMDSNQIQDLILQAENSISKYLSKLFPGVNFASEALIRNSSFEGFFNLLIFAGIIVVSLIIFILAGKSLYFKGLIGIGEGSAKREKLNEKDFSKKSLRKSSTHTYILNELRVLFRTPIYFLNCVLINFIWPVLLVVISFANGGSINQMKKVLNELLVGDEYNAMIFAIFFGIILFLSSSNGVTATSISREGSDIYLKKYIPIGYFKQIQAKIIVGILISLIGFIFITGFLIFLVDLSILMIVLLIILGLNAIVLISQVGIVFDLIHPKLGWDNEQVAVKQNMNVLYNMLAGIILAALFIAPIIVFKFSQYTAVIYIIILSSVINFSVLRLLKTKGAVWFDRITEF